MCFCLLGNIQLDRCPKLSWSGADLHAAAAHPLQRPAASEEQVAAAEALVLGMKVWLASALLCSCHIFVQRSCAAAEALLLGVKVRDFHPSAGPDVPCIAC